MTLKDAFATQTVCKTQSGWRQCSESCCETAVVHVELARVAGPRTPQEFLEALEDIFSEKANSGVPCLSCKTQRIPLFFRVVPDSPKIKPRKTGIRIIPANTARLFSTRRNTSRGPSSYTSIVALFARIVTRSRDPVIGPYPENKVWGHLFRLLWYEAIPKTISHRK